MWVYGKVEPGWYVAAIQFDNKISSEWKAKGYSVEAVDWNSDQAKRTGKPIPPSYIPQ